MSNVSPRLQNRDLSAGAVGKTLVAGLLCEWSGLAFRPPGCVFVFVKYRQDELRSRAIAPADVLLYEGLGRGVGSVLAKVPC